MAYISQGLWNTLFGWMSSKQCFLPEGCAVPVVGVAVYLFIIVFIVTVLYWLRNDIKDTALSVWERIPNPFS